MFPQNLGINPSDPTIPPVAQETINVIQDIESRLLALKLGLAQSVPQLAPALLWREQTLAALTAGRVPLALPSLATGAPFQATIPPHAQVNLGALLSMLSQPTSMPGMPVMPFAHVQGVPSGLVANPAALHPAALAQLLGLTTPGLLSGVVNPYGIATPFRY